MILDNPSFSDNSIFFIFYLFIFFTKPLRRCPLPFTLPKRREEKNDHQWPMAAAEATPKTGFRFRRGHCISSSWNSIFFKRYMFNSLLIRMK